MSAPSQLHLGAAKEIAKVHIRNSKFWSILKIQTENWLVIVIATWEVVFGVYIFFWFRYIFMRIEEKANHGLIYMTEFGYILASIVTCYVVWIQ